MHIANVLCSAGMMEVLVVSEDRMPFQNQLRRARPELAEHQAKNVRKRGIAVRLRALRDAKGLTQEEVAAAAGMTQSMIARLEALAGPVPSLETIERYVDACGGHLALLISDKQIDSERARGRFSEEIELGIEGRQPSQNSRKKA